MQSLLIVDDEPNIVEGIANQIEDLGENSLLIFKAFSGTEALSILKDNKIDVVLSDIKMAGLNGLELIGETSKLWPKIRFIFLTGYSDFKYIHEASKSPIYAGYLLKTEDNEVIIEKVMDELQKNDEMIKKESTLLLMQARMKKMQPLLHRIYLDSIIKGHLGHVRKTDEDTLSILQLDIDQTRPVLLVIGKIMDNRDYVCQFQDLMTADQLLHDEETSLFSSECLLCDDSILEWLLQPVAGELLFDSNPEAGDKTFCGYIHAVYQSLQQELNDYYSLPVSFVISSRLASLSEISVQFELLKTILLMLKLNNQSLMLIDQNMENDVLLSGDILQIPEQLLFSSKIKRLEQILDSGMSNEFRCAFDELFPDQLESAIQLEGEQLLILIMMMLSAIKRHNLTDLLSDNIFLKNRLIPTNAVEKEAFFRKYIDTCCRICDMRMEQEVLSNRNIIARINSYIDANIENHNLSLTQIAKDTGFNPSYLSRFYKQNIGENLSDYISFRKLEHAKELLKTDMLINDVAYRTGYESPSSFILFFKRRLGITPKQYQSQCRL